MFGTLGKRLEPNTRNEKGKIRAETRLTSCRARRASIDFRARIEAIEG